MIRSMLKSAAPVLLVSMPQMADPNFVQTVILLCEYTEAGAFGLVLNRQMHEPAWTLVQAEPAVEVDPEVRLWLGGPVDPQRTWVLMADTDGPDDERSEIAPGVLLSVSHELTLRTLQRPPSPTVRLVAGYAGWGPGQLDEEIADSAWLVSDVDPELIFRVPPGAMWELALRRLGASPAALQTSSGVH